MLKLQVENFRNLEFFNMEIPIKKGVHAITGENGVGKSTILNILSKVVYEGALNSYFKNDGNSESKITFEYNGKKNIWVKKSQWQKSEDTSDEIITFKGTHEASLIYGNRFSDANKELLKKLNQISPNGWVDADKFIIEKLGLILRNDISFYKNLRRIRSIKFAKDIGFKNRLYSIRTENDIIHQVRMSSGEFLIITLLDYLYSRIQKFKDHSSNNISLIFLDEIELALHPIAQKRLIEFLNEIANQNNFCIYFSTHSPQILSSITPENIFHLEKVRGSNNIKIINPCYPAYATRQLYMEGGFDFLFLVEDILSKYIINKIINDLNINNNKLIYILPTGGWKNTLSLYKELFQSRATGSKCKVVTILDGDIETDYDKEYSEDLFFKNKENKNMHPLSFLPIMSIEKYLKHHLIDTPNDSFINELGNKFFNVRSIDDIIHDYKSHSKSKDDSNGKNLFKMLCACYEDTGQSIELFKCQLCELITQRVVEMEKLERFINNVTKSL